MKKSFSYNSIQPLVHKDNHPLPKPHMAAPCSINSDLNLISGIDERKAAHMDTYSLFDRVVVSKSYM